MEIGAAQTFEQRETDKYTESYIILKILLSYCIKKLFQQLRKTFENLRLKAENQQKFEINKTLYSNSER